MREPQKFVSGEHTYRVQPMDAMKQLHVARRLAPLLSAFRDHLSATSPAPGQDPPPKAEPLDLMGPLMAAVSGLSDADTDYVIATCLGTLHREIDGGLGWTPVWNTTAKRLQFEAEMTALDVLTLTVRVIISNMADFTSAPSLISGLTAPPRAA